MYELHATRIARRVVEESMERARVAPDEPGIDDWDTSGPHVTPWQHAFPDIASDLFFAAESSRTELAAIDALGDPLVSQEAAFKVLAQLKSNRGITAAFSAWRVRPNLHAARYLNVALSSERRWLHTEGSYSQLTGVYLTMSDRNREKQYPPSQVSSPLQPLSPQEVEGIRKALRVGGEQELAALSVLCAIPTRVLGPELSVAAKHTSASWLRAAYARAACGALPDNEHLIVSNVAELLAIEEAPVDEAVCDFLSCAEQYGGISLSPESIIALAKRGEASAARRIDNASLTRPELRRLTSLRKRFAEIAAGANVR